MTSTITTPDARVRATVRFADLGVARENLRHDEPADEDIPQLAASIRAAGVLLPLTVRAGRGRKERSWMALDGRRRLLALSILREAGEIDDDFPVEVFEETEPERQAAAAVLTNTAAPVHVADVIVAVGRMLKARLTPASIAGALGQDEIDIKRLAALADLPPAALDGLRQGRLSLRQARLLARVPSREAQTEILEAMGEGHGFQEWRIHEQLNGAGVTPRDRRCALVPPDAYVEAGGRLETDLFGEMPPRLLDPAVLSRVWEARAKAIADALADDAIAVVASAEAGGVAPDGLEHLHESLGWDLSGEARDVWLAAREAAQAESDRVREGVIADPATEPLLIAFCRARLALDAASEPARSITFVRLTPHQETGLEVRCFGPPLDETDASTEGGEGETPPIAPEPDVPTNVVAFPPPEPEGGLAQSQADTEVATQGLARAIADSPETALIAVVARLFESVSGRGRTEGLRGAVAIRSDPRRRDAERCLEALEGDVRRRLSERREAFESSGLSAIGWVSAMEMEDRLSLLALAVALSLDLADLRTGRMRAPARADAAEIAALSRADLRLHWTPDVAFLRVHTKAQLLAMLETMGAETGPARDLSKPELVDRVAEEASARAWAPASLVWDVDPTEPADEAPADAVAGG